MNSKTLLSSILFTSLFLLNPAIAQVASADADAAVAAQATVPTEQMVARYTELAGSAEAATALIERLRFDADTATTMGYGEINLTLALAGALVDSGAATAVDAAVDSVLQLRADGMGWGQIAQELGFNLGHVISATHRAGAAAQSAGNAEAGLAIAEENRGRASGNAGASTAASAGAQANVGRGIAADAKVNARIDRSLRGSTSGRPAGVGAPTLPQRVERPVRLERPMRLERPLRGGR